MTINIYGKYYVRYRDKHTYCSRSDFDKISYGTETIRWQRKKMSGAELLELVGNLLKDKETIFISTTDSKIHVATFNPDHGTGSDILIKYAIREVNNGTSK